MKEWTLMSKKETQSHLPHQPHLLIPILPRDQTFLAEVTLYMVVQR